MSLLSEPDYVLQCLRLQFLRRCTDPLGPSIITFPESFSPHILLSDLNDPEVWPELGIVRSPEPVAVERPARRLKKLDGGLNYSETIVGNHGGRAGAGMRVGGRTRSWMGRGEANRMRQDGSTSDSAAGKGKAREVTPMLDEEEDEESEGEEILQAPDEKDLVGDDSTVANESLHTLRNNPGSSFDHLRPRSSLKRTASRPSHLPTVTIQSPIVTPQDSPAIPDTPVDGDEYESSSHTGNGDESDSGYPDNSTRPERRSRPVTLINSPAYGHDRELSDALRWDADALGQVQEEDELMSSASPVFQLRSVGDRQDNVDVDDQIDLAAEMETPVSPTGPLDDPSSIDTYSFVPAANTQDDYDFLSSSILSASSLAVKNSRFRRQGFRLQPVESITEPHKPDSMTVTGPPSQAEKADKAIDGNSDASAGRKRERRRVNISGKLLPLQPATGIPAFKAIPEESELSSPQKLQTPGRARADTEPRQSSFLPAQPSLAIRRQVSSDGLSRSRLMTKSVNENDVNLIRKRALSNVSARNRSASDTAMSANLGPAKARQSLDFTRVIPKAPLPKQSALTTLISQKETEDISANPFTSHYGALIMRAAGNDSVLKLKLFFPHCGGREAKKPLDIKMRKDVTVEEVIGSGLWAYWEEDKQPSLLSEKEKEDWDGIELKGRLDPARWNLMIVEDDDGDVDEDFPALDRIRNISAFSFPAFALVEANETQYQQNRMVQDQIERRPSRIINTRPKLLQTSSGNLGETSPGLLVPSTSAQNINVDLLSTSMIEGRSFVPVPASYAAPGGLDVYLRVRIPMPGLEAVVSTVKVTTNTYLADVLDTICRKRKEQLGDSKQWVLMLGDQDIIVPLDRTIESLQGSYNLRLAKKTDVAALVTAETRDRFGRLVNRDPSASIFKRLSEPAQPKYISASDVTSLYKRFTVFRKHAMNIGRHERILAIDGEKLSILHPSHEPGRTTTFHISKVHDCKPSKRMPNSFKLIVDIDRELKRYDFEAENKRQSQEIIQTIQNAKQMQKDRQLIA